MIRIVLTLLAIILGFAPTRAEQISVYEVISARQRFTDAIAFSSSTWTELVDAASGVTCYSCFGQVLFMSTERLAPARRVVFSWGFYDNTGTTQVRLVSFYVDASGNRVYNRTWPISVKIPCCNPSPPFVDVTAQWNAYFASLPIMTGGANLNGVMFLVEVLGSGSIFMSRIIVDY